MARLTKMQRLEKKKKLEEYEVSTPPSTSPALSGAELFEQLAIEANEIRFNGPAFRAEAALDGGSISSSFEDFQARSTPPGFEDDDELKRVVTSSLCSKLASRVVETTDANLPSATFRAFEIDGFETDDLAVLFGEFTTGEDGISMTLVDPVGHVKALSRACLQCSENMDWHTSLVSLWMPVRPNDPRTRLTVAQALWNQVRHAGKNSPSLCEIHENIFSKAPKEFVITLAALGVPGPILKPDLWRGYRTEEAFVGIFSDPEVRDAFRDYLNLPVYPEHLEALMMMRDTNQTINAMEIAVRTLALRYGIDHYVVPRAGEEPSLMQVVHYQASEPHGPPGLLGVPPLSERESDCSAILFSELAYIQQVGG